MIYRTLFLLLLLVVTPLKAEEPEQEQDSDFSWQLMASFSLRNNTSIIVGADTDPELGVRLPIDLYYKGFFIQSSSRKFSSLDQGVTLGYELINEENWQLDIISKDYFNGFSERGVDIFDEDFPPELKGIKDREEDESQGMRFTYFMDDAVLWVDTAANLLSNVHNGWIIDSYYSLLYPYRNWDFYLGTGFTFYSSKFTDYYYGVDADEVTSFRPEYSADSSYRIQFEAMAQYPLSESWLLGAGLHYSYYSSSISDSPLVDRNNNLQFILDFRYVF